MEEAIRNLYAAVIYQAIKDYPKKKYQAEVREFFTNAEVPYFDILDLQREDILHKLESGKIKIEEE